MSNSGAAIQRPSADRKKALCREDSLLAAQLYWDVELGHTVLIQKIMQWRFAPDDHKEAWDVRDARTDQYLGSITHPTKIARTDVGGQYINLDDVDTDTRRFDTKRGICPACQREPATEDPERKLTLFVNPDETEGWAECDQNRGHRYPITEVLLRE